MSTKSDWSWGVPFLGGATAGAFMVIILFSVFGKNKTDFVSRDKSSVGARMAAGLCPPERAPQAVEAQILPPPEFIEELPDVIEASRDGRAEVEWKSVPKALSYVVSLYDARGHKVNVIKTPFTNVVLKDLRTGEDASEARFLVSVATVNIDGQVGSRNKPRQVLAKDRPDITAPTIKSIKTED